ncbi:hypothetical protein MMC28_005491 [Mycoblastus sanguinarius]|nr:hypothetical protein [Mycoblastus sanguinarius]
MAQYYPQQPQAPYNPSNLQFYQSTYAAPVSGHSTPSQAQYGASYGQAQQPHSSQAYGAGPGFGAAPAFGPGVSGRMGEQGGLRTGWIAAFGTEGYEGEPPLLEELGVNFGHIKGKVRKKESQAAKQRASYMYRTLTVLNPLTPMSQHIMDDSDLAGPILFFLLFGTFLLFSGKVHFGYIYGLALVGSLSLHTIFSLMSPPPDNNGNSPTSTPGRRRRGRAERAVQHAYVSEECVGVGVLPPPARADEFCGGGAADGYGGWVCDFVLGDMLVHV